MRLHFTEQNVQSLFGKAVQHHHRCGRRICSLVSRLKALAVQQKADRLTGRDCFDVLNSHAHANEHGLERRSLFARLRLKI